MSALLMWIEAVVCGLAWSGMLLVWRRTVLHRYAGSALLIGGIGLPLLAWGGAATLTWMAYRSFDVGGGLAGLCIAGLAVQLVSAYAMGTRGAGWPSRERAATAWGLAGLLLVMTLWNADLAVRQRMAVLRTEAGAAIMSVTPPRPADRDNAGPLYEQAADVLVAPTPEQESAWYAWTDPRAPIAIDTAAADVAAHLETNAGALELVRRAARLPGCSFGHSTAQLGPELQLPELANMRRLARLLALAARALAQSGHGDLALADTDAIVALSAHTAGGPALLHGVVGIACERIAYRTLAGVAADLAVKPAGWRLPALETATMTWRQQIRRSLLADQAFGLSAFADLIGSPDLDLFGNLASVGEPGSYLDAMAMMGAGPSTMMWRVFYLEADLLSYRHVFCTMIERTNQPSSSPQARIRVDEAPGICTRLLIPALDGVLGNARKVDAERELARAAVRCLNHRDATGAFPANLSDLDGPTPTDPFDGKPLRMRATSATELVIYSVGPDGKDDGGRAPDSTSADAGGDLVFTLVAMAR